MFVTALNTVKLLQQAQPHRIRVEGLVIARFMLYHIKGPQDPIYIEGSKPVTGEPFPDIRYAGDMLPDEAITRIM